MIFACPTPFSLIQDSNTQSSFYKNDSRIVYENNYLLYNFPNSDYYDQRQCMMIIVHVYGFGTSLMVMCLTRKKEIRLSSSRKNKHRALLTKCLEEKVIWNLSVTDFRSLETMEENQFENGSNCDSSQS